MITLGELLMVVLLSIDQELIWDMWQDWMAIGFMDLAINFGRILINLILPQPRSFVERKILHKGLFGYL